MDKKNKIILISGISVVSLTLLATIISVLNPEKAPDPQELGSRKKISYMASKQFTRLPEKEKTTYVKKLGRSSMKEYRKLDPKERNIVIQNTMKIRMKIFKTRLNKFFAMSKEEQDKHLDEQIAKWSKNRKRWSQNRKKSDNKKSNKKRSNVNMNAIKQTFLEGTDSTTRAQMMEYFRRMKARSQKNK